MISKDIPKWKMALLTAKFKDFTLPDNLHDLINNPLHTSKSFLRSAVFLSQNSKQNNNNNYGKRTARTVKNIIGATAVGVLGYSLYNIFDERRSFVAANFKHVSNETADVGKFKKGLPTYCFTDVNKHNSTASLWVVYKEGVYDITDYVEIHPGGDQILKGAGISIEPFWDIFSVHKKEYVYEILESYRIGNLRKEDVGKFTVVDVVDLFANEPVRHPGLKVISQKPFCGGCDPEVLTQNKKYTPNEFFYVRNHLFVPDLDPKTYEILVEVEGTDKKLTLSLDEIKKMPAVKLTATLYCSGNRRTEMAKVKPVAAVMWGPTGVGNAIWTGVRLRDILKQVGIDEDHDEKYKHVHFEGHDFDAKGTHFSGSIPIWKAVTKRADAMLVYEMNGVPLPRDHGFPLRLIVPGCAGVRCTKWISKITVSEKESMAFWYHNDYKPFAPSTDVSNVDYSKSPALIELPINSFMCEPAENATVDVSDGRVLIKGWAWSGNGQKIIRVDVTADQGKTWHTADFDYQEQTEPSRHWSWTQWSIRIPVEKSKNNIEVWCKAVDSCAHTQPETFENIYNFRGVLCNAYHRLKLNLK